MDKQLTIGDIYCGELDAKDEVALVGFDDFVESFVMPNNLDVDKLFNNPKCFISGYKGTGKTALLYYLEDYFHKKDSSTVSVFIPFKENYNETKRKNMQNAAQRIISPLIINRNAQEYDDDFEYIWSWELFKIIIDANGKNKGKLFVSDGNWKNLKNTIKKIDKDSNISKFVLKPSITFNQTDSPSFTAMIESEKALRIDAYQKFVELIDEAYELLKLVIRTDTPFYIFIDELEAYYGNPNIFTRDLRMIRDIIFTTKRFNMILWKNRKFNTKIICAFRTEILNAINRFVIPKEINKSVGGFEVPLKWDYSNTNSIDHPIIRILLRRIQIAEQKNGNSITEANVYEKWFPDKFIENSNIVSYILNITWNKPRDIVRLLMIIQSGIKKESQGFTRDVFDVSLKNYSIKSLEEINEEMLAIYSTDNIEDIMGPLKGYRVTFTKEELTKHLETNYSHTIFTEKEDQVLRDLYRLGVIGNYSQVSDSHHWQHKGDDGPLYTNEWQLQIHRALWGALLVSRRHDNAVNRIARLENILSGKVHSVDVTDIRRDYAVVNFTADEELFTGLIFKKDIANEFVTNIEDYIWIGERFDAKIMYYDVSHGNWILSRNY